MTKSERAIEILKAEWLHCEAGIARYDTLIFQVRTWAITISAAMVAAAFSSRVPAIVLVGAVSPALFLFLDAQNKVFQQVFIMRSHFIQRSLREYIDSAAISDESLQRPSIAGMFQIQASESLAAHLKKILKCSLFPNVLPFYALLSLVCTMCFLIAR